MDNGFTVLPPSASRLTASPAEVDTKHQNEGDTTLRLLDLVCDVYIDNRGVISLMILGKV
jgi:hypothetical protein